MKIQTKVNKHHRIKVTNMAPYVLLYIHVSKMFFRMLNLLLSMLITNKTQYLLIVEKYYC